MRYSLEHKVNKTGINLFFIYTLALGMMLTGHNELLNIFSFTIITGALILNLRKDEFLYSYFAIIFFEAILLVPSFGGSFFRIYQLLFLLRVVIDLFYNYRYKTSLKLNIIASFIFLFLSISYTESLVGMISMVINIFILVYILTFFKIEFRSTSIKRIFIFNGVFSSLSGIYGLFFIDPYSYGYVYRQLGTMGDPNYSALFYTLGIFSVVGNDLISKNNKRILLIILFSLLLGTISIAGIFGTILLVILYLYFVNRIKGFIYGVLGIIGILIFISFNYVYGTIFYGIKFRINAFFLTEDLNVITSGRFGLTSGYLSNFFNLPLKDQFLGGNNTVSGTFRDNMVLRFGDVSHSSYIDMLYMVGILGIIIIISIFIIMIIKNIKYFYKTKNEIFLSIAFTKMVILYYSITISIFPFRYFYTFLLI